VLSLAGAITAGVVLAILYPAVQPLLHHFHHH
jgi:hypothetical protein